jgi:hypothetical protein
MKRKPTGQKYRNLINRKGALLHGAAMIKVVPSIDEDQAIG